MNRLRRIVGNTLISLLGQAVTWTSTLLLTIAYGRFLGDRVFGELFLALSFVALFGFPLEFGFNQQLTRAVAQKPADALRYLSNILLIKGGIWLFLYGLIILASILLKYSYEQIMLIAICGVGLLVDGTANVFASLHFATENVKFPVVGGILQKGLSALVGFLALKQGADVETMAFILLGGSFLNAGWQAIWCFRLIGHHFTVDGQLIRDLLRSCIPFIVYGALAVIYYRIDTLFLSFMTNTRVIGWYGAAYRLLDTLNFLPNLVILAIMYPLFSKLSVSDDKSLRVAVEKSMNFLLFCGVPLATLLIVAAPNIIGFLYHQKDFVHSVPALQALAPGLLFLYANTVLGSTIMSVKQERKITIMAAIALVFNVSLNLILIPRYQHVGSAAVTSLTEFLLLCLSIYFTPRELLPIKSMLVGVKAILSSLIMALVIWKLLVLNIFLVLPIAMVTYIAASLVLQTIPRQDMLILYQAIRKKAAPAPTSATASQNQQEEREQMAQEVLDALSFSDVITMPLPAVSGLQNIPQIVLHTRRHSKIVLVPLPPVSAFPEVPRTEDDLQLSLSENDIETIPMKAVRHGKQRHKVQQRDPVELKAQEQTVRAEK